jgi:hypothetical protein
MAKEIEIPQSYMYSPSQSNNRKGVQQYCKQQKSNAEAKYDYYIMPLKSKNSKRDLPKLYLSYTVMGLSYMCHESLKIIGPPSIFNTEI